LRRLEAESYIGGILATFVNAYLEEQRALEAVPLLKPDFARPHVLGSSLEHVLNVVIEQFPRPDGSVSLEQVLDFRRDPESHSRYLGLRRWMRKISKESLSAREIHDELEWLMREYRDHLKLHRLKTRHGRLEAVVVTAADILENHSCPN
jgi:hypothetical protein